MECRRRGSRTWQKLGHSIRTSSAAHVVTINLVHVDDPCRGIPLAASRMLARAFWASARRLRSRQIGVILGGTGDHVYVVACPGIERGHSVRA